MRVPGCLGVVGSLREGTSASSSEGNGIGGRPAGEQSGSKGGGRGGENGGIGRLDRRRPWLVWKQKQQPPANTKQENRRN